MKKDTSQVCIVTSEFPPAPGGIGTHAYQLAKYLQTSGFNVTVLCDQRESLEKEQSFDAGLAINVVRVSLKKLRVVMYFERILKVFKIIKSSSTIIASGKFSLWLVAFMSLFYKRNYIAVVHGSEVNFSNTLLKKSVLVSLKRFKHIVAVSQFTKQLIASTFNNITVIPNGIDQVELNKIPDINLDIKGSPKLVTVGRLSERKGQINVIKHLPQLIEQYPDIHYHCVGLPAIKDTLLQEAKSLGVLNHVTCHGTVSNKELKAFLKASDLFVMLSKTDKKGDVEGFGIAILEANYFGLPAIGALHCGIEDAIQEKETGHLIVYNDSKAFKHSVTEILNNKTSYSNHAKTWAEKHTWEVIISQYIDVIKQ
ncbi:glycosyltransferase family 4 protein [Corallibacter sp.]|uniref:glycosyltransferase family 4 protein n=1 Tax=Corallibacter sp. TaxID=2038084 RepID=UPI003A9261DC